MLVPREFVQAWYVWQQTPPPVENFRRGVIEARTWAIECDLDLLCTWLFALSAAVFEGRTCNLARMAREDLGELMRLELEMERIPLREKERKRFRKYFALTRFMLGAIIRCKRPGNNLPVTGRRPNPPGTR